MWSLQVLFNASLFPPSLLFTGDLERKFDLEISPLCNQQSDSVPAIQIGESLNV